MDASNSGCFSSDFGLCRSDKSLTQTIPLLAEWSFITDQGAQFTSAAFIGALTVHPSINIRMDGRGRALDNIFVERLWRNVKHEDIYFKGYFTASELQCGLKKYFIEYSVERSHQSLGYSTAVKSLPGSQLRRCKNSLTSTARRTSRQKSSR